VSQETHILSQRVSLETHNVSPTDGYKTSPAPIKNEPLQLVRFLAGTTPVLRSSNLNTSNQQKKLTMSHPTPIIGREALVSLVDWVNTIRRQQDERAISEDSGNREADSGGSQAAHYGAVSANDSPAARSERHREQGEHGEEGA